MAILDWILVAFGAAVAFTGGWIQLRPERVVSRLGGSSLDQNLSLEPSDLTRVRLLGGCFLFMGAFFALQMTVDLTGLPWWTGTLSGFITALISVILVSVRVRRQHRRRRQFVQQTPLPTKVLELR